MTDKTISQIVDAWIEQHDGKVRDALIVAIVRLQSAQEIIKDLTEELEDARREWFEKECV